MNRLDKIFRQKLYHHTESSPTHLWDNIESRLPQENKRSPLFFFSVLVLFCLVTGGVYELSKMSDQGKKGYPYTSNGVKNSEHQTLAVQTTKEKSISSEKEKTTGFRSIEPAGQSKIVLSGWNEPATENNQALEQTERIEAPVAQTIDNPERIEPIAIRIMQNTKTPLRISSVLPTDVSAQPIKEIKACPFHFDTQNKSMDVYFSHEYGLKTLIGDPVYSEHIQMREQTETGRYSFAAGVRFGYNLSYRWNLHTGVNYSQINEKFEYTDPESNQTRLITIKDYVYENGKIVDSIITEEVVIVPGMTKMKIFNNYRTLDIPVLARFTLFANRWMSLSALGGVYINLTSRQQGTILGPDNKTLVNISPSDTNGPSVFKTQLGVSGMAGASMAIHLNSSIDFLLEPHVRYYTSYMNTENYPANQKFTVAGLITGLRYKF